MLHVICRITIEGKQLNCCSNVWRPPAYNKPLTPESVAEGLASGSFVGPIFGAPYPGGLFEAAAAGSAARSSSTAGSSSASEETSDGENSSPRAKRAKCAKRNTQPTPRGMFYKTLGILFEEMLHLVFAGSRCHGFWRLNPNVLFFLFSL